MRRLLLLPAALLACLLTVGPAGASALVYSVYSPYLKHEVRTGIYTSRADGSQPARLTKGQHDSSARWSPDRSHLAFVRTRYESRVPKTLSTVESVLFVMRLDGSDKRVISRQPEHFAGFDWSPDSRKLVFARDGDLFVATRRGNEESQLTEMPQSESHPIWSPDGADIAFTGTSVGTDPLGPAMSGDIYVVPAGGGTPRRLTTHGGDDFEPQWSPDGTSIAFVSTRDHCCDYESYGSDIYVVASDGTDERRVTEDCTYKESQRWLPGSSVLIYQSSADDDGCPLSFRYSSLNSIDVISGTRREILPRSWYAGEVAVEPRGRWIAFTTTRAEEQGTDLYRVRVRDGLIRQITDNNRKASDVDPDW